MLAKVLQSIKRIQTLSTLTLSLLVIDNDPLRSAEPIVKNFHWCWPVRYIVESKPGVASARNAALKYSTSTDWVVFVDDDEVVDPEWLISMLGTANKFGADVVAGPVLPMFGDGVPQWFIKGGFASRPRSKTGETPKWLGTGNVLLAQNLLQQCGSFDERFSLTGGEDTELFCRIAQSGFKVVWCDEAIVHEYVGPERANMQRQLRRAYHDAALWSVIERMHDPSLTTRVSRATKSAVYTLRGMSALMLALFRGKHHIVHALEIFSEGLGMLGGLMGAVHEPYRPVTVTLERK